MLPENFYKSLGAILDSSLPHSHYPTSSTALESILSLHLLLHLLLHWKTAMPPNDVPAYSPISSRPPTTRHPAPSLKNSTGKGHLQLKSLQWLLSSQGKVQTFSFLGHQGWM